MIDRVRYNRSAVRSRTAFSVVAVFLCAALSVPAFGSLAWADVRKTDIVLGQNVEARGLTASQCPSVDAEYALVIDDQGTVYFERGATTPAKVASMTKIMTAVVAIEYGALTDVVTVDREAASVGESSASLREGDSMTLDVALSALMVPSGNDAAIAIAKTVGAKIDPSSPDPQGVFVRVMNEKAAEIGCRDTVFENPHGLDLGAYRGSLHSTAADMGAIVRYAMQNETFRAVVGQGDTPITVTGADGAQREIMLETTDELFGVYEGICGVKTGYTGEAGYCFAGAVARDEGTFYTVVMNSPSSAQRFNDTKSLMDWAYEHTVFYPFAHTAHTVTMPGLSDDVPLVAEFPHADWIDVTVPVTLSDPSAGATVFDLCGNINQNVVAYDIHGDIHAGDVVGQITFQQRSRVIATVDLVAAQDVDAPGFFEGVGIWWDRLFRGFSGEPTVAQQIVYNETPILLDKTD